MGLATVHAKRWTGLSGAPTKTTIDGSSTRYSTSDNPTPGDTFPIPIPSESTRYSYWCVVRLYAEVPSGCTVNNVKCYTEDADWQGITLKGNTATTYIQATGTEGTTGTELNTTNYSSLSAAPEDVEDWTSVSPKPVTGSVVGPDAGSDFGDYIATQLFVTVEASPGTMGSATFYFNYDEVT